jgi:hypothetical protein
VLLLQHTAIFSVHIIPIKANYVPFEVQINLILQMAQVLLCPVLSDVLKLIYLCESSEAWPACPSDHSSAKMNQGIWSIIILTRKPSPREFVPLSLGPRQISRGMVFGSNRVLRGERQATYLAQLLKTFM